MSTSSRILVAPLTRKRGLAVALVPAPPTPERGPSRRPATAARMLALAHHVQRAIDDGKLLHQADAARRFGLTRARLTQLLDLLLLAPEIQVAVLHAEAVDGQEPFSERSLRPIVAERSWVAQQHLWVSLQTVRGRRPAEKRSEIRGGCSCIQKSPGGPAQQLR